MDATCSHCAGQLDWRARSDARHCSTRCRVAAHRAGRPDVPEALRSRGRWVRWERVTRAGATTKRPVRVDGGSASSTDPATWTTHEAAGSSPVGDGVGFVLSGDGIVCIDLDHCVSADGRIASWARRLVNLAGGTYVERSPSGTGLHIWGFAAMAGGRVVQVDGGTAEVYADQRYVTVTGDRLRGTGRELADVSGLVDALVTARV